MHSTQFYYSGSISNRAITIKPTSWQPKTRKESIKSLLNLRNPLNFGYVSENSCRKMKNAINLIIDTAEVKQFQLDENGQVYTFDVNFITLTLPSKQMHSDNEIKSKCLGQFLTEWRKREPNLRYFWRAEKQHNKNIHFHILSNQFYHYKNIRKDWNRIVEKLGYVTNFANDYTGMSLKSYKAKFRNSDVSDSVLTERWTKGTAAGWREPNSTDVHAISQINDVAAYVSKYCVKDSAGLRIKDREQVNSNVINRTKVKLSVKEIVNLRSEVNIVEGRIWGCDTTTSRYQNVKFNQMDDDFETVMELAQTQATKIIYKDYITIFYGKFHKVLMNAESDSLLMYQLNISKYVTAQPIPN